MNVVDLVLALPNNPAARPWKQRDLSQIQWLVVHHAASTEDATPQALNNYHHSRRPPKSGWFRLSYHYTIGANGIISKINPATSITWTVANANSRVLSVCLIGNRDKIPCPQEQWDSLVWLCKRLRDAYPTIKHLYGHKECPTSLPKRTACPGRFIDMNRLRADVSWREEEV